MAARARGRTAEAIPEARRALEPDPGTEAVTHVHGNTLGARDSARRRAVSMTIAAA